MRTPLIRCESAEPKRHRKSQRVTEKRFFSDSDTPQNHQRFKNTRISYDVTHLLRTLAANLLSRYDGQSALEFFDYIAIVEYIESRSNSGWDRQWPGFDSPFTNPEYLDGRRLFCSSTLLSFGRKSEEG